MSGRKLGGGRILGNGKSLAPPPPLAHQRTSSLISSTAASSVSSGGSSASPLATSPLQDEQDLSSVVSLQNGSGREASSRLLCPICNEEMMTLLQLNRHLDDNHQELPAVEQDEVKNWFDKQVIKAKNFQPLAVINQKLKGLDVFESNESLYIPVSTPVSHAGNRLSTPEPARAVDPDEVVTRAHWQRTGFNDLCSEPACGKRLGAVNGSVNCRKCGLLFCEDHTMYQMKLSRSAQHEPVRGLWCRTCETCFKSREGYNDHNGLVRDDSADFFAMRRRKVDKEYLEISRLEKRLTKLTQLLANPPEDFVGGHSGLLSLSGQKNQRKLLEQSVVTWEEDAQVSKCCSTEIGLNVTTKKNGTPGLGIDVRMCRDCKATVFSKKDFAAELSHKPPDQRSYENLLQFEKGIRLLLPKFQRLLIALQDPDKPPSHQTLTEASKVRKRLIDSFGKYDLAAKRIRDLPTSSSAQAKLQRAIYQQAANFLSIHMLPLKSLPNILKHASPHGSNGLTPNGRGALAAIKYNDVDSASQISSSSAVSAMEAEEKELRERVIVLEEQKFLVARMVDAAKKARRFDEVSALCGNLADLGREIDEVSGMIGQLDFAGVYTGGDNRLLGIGR
ncbi:hypothetical protein JHW43_003961 [Diplocarpon mali]|nr:hypothetical protein JHW43_003961 [Diplocarpon mali]